MLIGIVVLILMLIVGIVIFMYTSPQFGQVPRGDALEKIRQSSNYKENEFKNLVKTEMDMGFSKIISTSYAYFTNTNQKSPNKPIPTNFDFTSPPENAHEALVTWFGHSALLIEMEGQRILVDPMLGPASSPVSFLSKRFRYQHEIPLATIQNIDVLLISHDHYDHLDYVSIQMLIPHTKLFLVPLGVGSHLIKWGVDKNKIVELDWWQSVRQGAIEFIATPARHFSGRGFSDRNKTLWASWVIKGKDNNLFFSGDGGYFDGFKTIGEQYGPFDFTMIECGQYNENWAAIHMMPEESVQAHLDVKGKVMMPIHWGAFNLALHSWSDPVERLAASAKEHDVSVYYPVVGKRFTLSETANQSKIWWKSHQ